MKDFRLVFSVMLSQAEEKRIRSLHAKKGRKETGLCLVEGEKNIEAAGDAVEFTFTKEDSVRFEQLVTTDTPQEIAAVAKIPSFSRDDILEAKTIIVLDGVQDPGNVGTILRLCLAFNASLILIESADPASPKVIRSSAGALFHLPWMRMSRAEAHGFLTDLDRPIYRLEKNDASVSIDKMSKEPIALIAGSEGQGIELTIPGESVAIAHDPRIESLNVGTALAIALHARK